MLGDISAEVLFAMTGEQLAAHIARQPTVIARRLNYLRERIDAKDLNAFSKLLYKGRARIEQDVRKVKRLINKNRSKRVLATSIRHCSSAVASSAMPKQPNRTKNFFPSSLISKL